MQRPCYETVASQEEVYAETEEQVVCVSGTFEHRDKLGPDEPTAANNDNRHTALHIRPGVLAEVVGHVLPGRCARRIRFGPAPTLEPARDRAHVNRLTNSSAFSATSRHPASIVRACPRPGILTISVTPLLRFCFS